MDTDLYRPPQELLDLRFSHLTLSSSPQQILHYSLVGRSWSYALLPLLYHSISLSTEDLIERFINCPVKNQYRVDSLALFVGKLDRMHVTKFDPDLMVRLFGSLDGQPLTSLVFGTMAKFPVDILAHPAVSGHLFR